MGFRPQGWDLGLKAGIWASRPGCRGEAEGEEGEEEEEEEEEEGEISPCV